MFLIRIIIVIAIIMALIPVVNKAMEYFDEKSQIVEGVKEFIKDMFDFNINLENISYEYADNLFDLMCTKAFIKNNKLFDIFFHDNYYVRDNIKKIIRQ